MEKHWKSVISRSVCDYFFDHQRKVTNPEDIPPVIATPHHYLISVHRCGMFFVAVCTTEGTFYPENFPERQHDLIWTTLFFSCTVVCR